MQARPGYEDVLDCVDRLKDNPLAKVSMIGKSVQGREIPLVELTDPRVDDADKQLVIITAGTHGSEEAGRAVGIAAMEWLASGEPYVSLRNQKFVIIPCVNPDGSIADTYHNAQDINLNRAYEMGGPIAHEAGVVLDAVGGLNPGLAVDLHGLAGGGMNEELYIHEGFRNSPVRLLARLLAEEARQAAENAGFPQREGQPSDVASLPQWMATRCNSLGYVLEVTENYYPLPLMRASGLIRLKALIAVGDRRNYYHYYPGYPCEAVSGSAMFWLCAHGRTARARGENRRQLLDAIAHIPTFQRFAADSDGAATVALTVDRDLPELPRFSVQLRIHKPGVLHGVFFDGRELTPGDEDGYVIWSDPASWIVRINIDRPLTRGEHRAVVRYDIRW